MKHHKLIQILKTFSKEEFSEFEKFVSSPIHNEGRNFSAFVKELKNHRKDFSSDKLTTKKIFNKIYSGKKYSESLVNTTLSRVLKMAQNYLTYKSSQKKIFAVKYNYIEELLNRELYDIAEKELRHYNDMQSDAEGITDETLKAQLDYEILRVQLSFRNDKQMDSTSAALNQTDLHIRFTLMRLAHFVHNLRVNNIIFNAEYKKTFTNKYLSAINLQSIYDTLKDSEEKSEPDEVTMIYLLWTLGAVDSKNEKHFYEMRELVYKNIERFHHHEKYNLFQALEALAWLRGQESNREKYDAELLEVYKERVKRKIFSPDRTHMRIILYRAILITSFYKPDWDFIEGFVKECIPMLQEEHKENMYNYSMAHIHYYKNEFEKALECNSKINFELFAFRYDSRLLQFKIYYELDYFNEAYSLIDAHKHFLHSNKTVSDYYREMHSNFLNFYGRILKHKEGADNFEPRQLQDELGKVNNVLAKQWLMEKIVDN